MATQAVLIAECFKQAHAGKAGRGAHKPWHAPSLTPGGQYNIGGRAWAKARLP